MGEYWNTKAASKSRRPLTPSMRADGLTFSMDRSYGAKRRGVFDSAFEDTASRFEKIVDRQFWRYARENLFGNPPTREWCGVRVSLSSFDFAYVLSQIAGRLPRGGSVVEIGAGYGGLARILLDYDPTMWLMLVDLEPISRIQEYYLRNVGRISGISETGLVYGGIRLASKMPNRLVDAVISTKMMCELDLKEVDAYLVRIDNALRTGGIFYCVHHDECRNNFEEWNIPPNWVLEREEDFPFRSFEKERYWRERLWRRA